ncbi:T9SS type A sorting domain-containing protein [Winogradskyella aquimaris]|uniref:T9SS type A sorting domain-containing protein n=1 Tax=Winogradskyella aquimaris TaxID=864074 RepID=A0ABU5EKH4_9FLAO|nr:T9SS type A sorting domain-containing protein [Winogradskyella aquimaris]MDY2586522.1 T9SS type A sorting domain-containing protein [Winogradskyella aquimaris]
MKKQLLLLILIPLINFSQVQIGQDIDGESFSDYSGNAISLSGNGLMLAIAAERNDSNGQDSGHVRIFENQLGSWVQVGNEINGEVANELFGRSVSLSNDGSIVAIGALGNPVSGNNSGIVRIYENLAGNWIQIGSDINGEFADDQAAGSTNSISLSSDGSIIAIGARYNNGNGQDSGHVRIFENQSGNWVQIGDDIDGEVNEDESGRSISLSSDGSIVAIGAIYNSGNGTNSGHVRIFENQSGNWVQIGDDINGEVAGDVFGWSVNLSNNGSIVAIGAPNNDGNGNISGHVRIFENQSGIWTQLGSDIEGRAAGDWFGYDVKLSSDGSIIAISATENGGIPPSTKGYVRIFKYQSGNWIQQGNDIEGEAPNDYSGGSIGLSDDGLVIAIGSRLNNGISGFASGHVRVYDLSAVLSVDSFKQDLFNVIVNDNEDLVEITLDNNQILNQVNLYTVDGKYLYSEKSLQLKTNTLSRGIYVIEVETDKGKSAKKVIIK